MLVMKNYLFKLSRKIFDFSEAVRRLDTTQDVQRSAIGSVNGNGHSLIIVVRFMRAHGKLFKLAKKVTGTKFRM